MRARYALTSAAAVVLPALNADCKSLIVAFAAHTLLSPAEPGPVTTNTSIATRTDRSDDRVAMRVIEYASSASASTRDARLSRHNRRSKAASAARWLTSPA